MHRIFVLIALLLVVSKGRSTVFCLPVELRRLIIIIDTPYHVFAKLSMSRLNCSQFCFYTLCGLYIFAIICKLSRMNLIRS